MPKVELHAHLSGCIRSEAIQKLLNKPGNENLRERSADLFDAHTGRTLQQCFDLFPVIHQLITDAVVLRRLVLNVLQDFADDNVIYLELRTTPRHSESFSSQEYLLTVLRAVAEFHAANSDALVCRILVSISRHLSVEMAWEAVNLTHQIMQSGEKDLSALIVGMELSGNPYKGVWNDFKPVFEYIRHHLHLPISLHFGEVLNDDESNAMLDFKPDRIGHAVVISDQVAKRIVSTEPKIGVEVCITSNLITKSVCTISEHTVTKYFLPSRHPFCLCTDDPGIFNTTLSKEYAQLWESLRLEQKDIHRIAAQGLQISFCRERHVIKKLMRKFQLGLESQSTI